jgi:hypothetical protein
MSHKHFVQLLLGSKTFGPSKVSTEGCSDVDDFTEEIKKKFSPLLDSYSAAQLNLYESNGTTQIDPETLIKDLFITTGKPLIVKVEENPSQRPIISSSRHQDYKHSKAVHSSRSYLTSIAVELEKMYTIEKANAKEPATFGDIIWNSWRTPKPIPKLSNLPDLKKYFTHQEWIFLEDLNNIVNPALHSELDFGIDGKSKEVILPIQISHLKATCQRIAQKAKVVGDVNDLIVKNEGSVSGGSPDSDKKV